MYNSNPLKWDFNKKKIVVPFSCLLLWNSKSYNRCVVTLQTGIFRNSFEDTAHKYDFFCDL
jgi:hypothetical protein